MFCSRPTLNHVIITDSVKSATVHVNTTSVPDLASISGRVIAEIRDIKEAIQLEPILTFNCLCNFDIHIILINMFEQTFFAIDLPSKAYYVLIILSNFAIVCLL